MTSYQASNIKEKDSKHKMTKIRSWISKAGVAVVLLLATGCMFQDVKKEIQEEKTTYGLFGRIEGISQTKADVFILLYTKKDIGLELDRYTLPDDTHTYSFIVTPGTYVVVAFEDSNHNQAHDPGESIGAWGRPDEIVVTRARKTKAREEALDNLDIKILPGPFPLPDADRRIDDEVKLSNSLYKLGQVAAWNDPAFDNENGATGLWKPMTFLRDQGIGIYFMRSYDSKKIPILFVHGAGGTPRDLQEMAKGLDLNRFQPWFYYYPSGLRLDQIATTLNYMVRRLQTDYGFDRMGVVAHSMGGLVSRSFIRKHLIEDGLKTVRIFVSISTPWGGVSMAKEGVESAPAAVPSWHDVTPESEFIQQIFADSLRQEIPHFLIFGYRGKCSLFMANNDGSVEVSSQLDLRAQKDATAIWGLNEDHMSILTSQDSIFFLNQALETTFPK